MSLFARKSNTLANIFPFESRYKTVDGHQMHYVDEGSGPVVVLLHGNPTWCFYYRVLIKELTPYFRVIAPDYIGCGLSDHPPDKHYRASDRTNQVEKLLELLGVERFSLVMHDWGGPIGTALAVRNVSAIERIVYLNTTLTEIESLPSIIKTAHAPIIGKIITQTTTRFLKLTTEFGVHRRLPKEIKEGYFHPYRTAARRTAIWDFVADIPFESDHPTYTELVGLAEKLPLLKDVPIQIVWGLKDPCFHREMLSKVAAHFPHAKVLEIPDASHLVLEDAPELANATIKEFLLEEREEKTTGVGAGTLSGSSNALYEALVRYAGENGSDDAVVEGEFRNDTGRYSHRSYSELLGLVNKYQRGLTELGLKKGDKVLFLVPVGLEFLALAYAVMGRGAVPLFVDPGVGRDNLRKCIADAMPDVLITVPKGHMLRLLWRKAFRGLKFHVTVTDGGLFRVGSDATLSFLKKYSSAPVESVGPVDSTMIAFTSGATGTPKGVVFTNEMVTWQLGIFRQSLGLEPGGRDVPLLPIFSLFNVAQGITAVFPPLDAAKPLALDAQKVVRMMQDLKVTSSFGSPTLWGKIADYCVRTGEKLPSMKRILMAGAPVTDDVIRRVEELLPEGEVIVPYGSTECLPATLVQGRVRVDAEVRPAESGEVGVLVGRPAEGVEVRIVEASEKALGSIEETKFLSSGRIGEILVRGANVSPSYYNRPDATRASKVRDGDRFWHRMGDVGYLDETGALYFCGRKAHVVKAPERVYYSVPVEKIFNRHEKVKRSALVDLGGGRPAVVVEPFPQFFPKGAEAEERFKAELREIGGSDPLTQRIETFFFHPSFPVDGRHNAKIFRDKLGAWAATQPA